MQKAVFVWITLILIGGLLIGTAPPDPQYSVGVYGPTDTLTGESAVAFENLSTQNQSLFEDSFDSASRSSTPADIQVMYVEYDGETYRMSESVGEGSLFSLLQPPVGLIFIMIGLLTAVYVHVIRR